MKKQPVTTHSERKLKLAEAGVLFVLILAITVIVGTKMASRGIDEEVIVAAEQSEINETVAAAAAEEVPYEADVVADAVPVADAMTGAVPETLTVESEAMPLVATYAASEQAYFGGDFERAAEMFTAYTLDHPDNAWGHYMLGLSSWKSGDNDGAEEAFAAALDIKPDHLKSRVNYGRVLLEMQRADEAREQLEAALEIDPNSVDALRVLGRAYHNLGRLDEAAEAYRGALTIRIDDVWSLNNLGLIFIEQERFDEALPALAKAAGLKSDAACIQNNLGVALERNGYVKDAALAFERALAANENYAKAADSLERVADLAIASDEPAVDLAVLAEGFTVTTEEPVIVEAPAASEATIEETVDGVTEETIEVASGDGQDD